MQLKPQTYYRPVPEPREWWELRGSPDWNVESRHESLDCARRHQQYKPGTRIVHVREITETEEA